jgi:ribosomal protein S18 acetylase RimI-like enzyme
MVISIREYALEIRPITPDNLEAVLEVYLQCEDFLALCPVPDASMEMVLKDIEISKGEGGIYCGIFTEAGEMIGILDYVPGNYQGDPDNAYLALLMLAAPFRNRGFGKAVVEAFEDEVRKDERVKTVLAGVQVNNPKAVRFWQRQGYRIVSGPKLFDQTMVYDLRKDLIPCPRKGCRP